MKKLIIMFFSLSFITIINTGCVGTIYSAVLDERNVKTIASDKSIELQILRNITDGKSSDLMEVSVTSYNGNVFLVGEYKNTSQKNRFLNAAKKIEGIKSVKSYLLQVKKDSSCDTKKNLEITVNVKSKLIGDGSIWSTNINVSTIQCQVVLWGTVGTSSEIKKSINHAKSVKGVKSVKSFLKSTK